MYIGEHPGDLERFMMTLKKDSQGNFTPMTATFEAHGTSTDYPLEKVKFVDGTHVAISVGLNGHGIGNESQVGSVNAEFTQPGSVLIGDFYGGNGAIMWNPWKDATNFIQLGIDSDKNPINDQLWVTYAGRMGDSYSTSLNGAHYFYGSNLSSLDWSFVKITFGVADLLGKIPAALLHSEGPQGPGGRHWINLTRAK
jgi:hypothetical protein